MKLLLTLTLILWGLSIQANKCDQSGKEIMAQQNKVQSAKAEEEGQEIVILDTKTNKKEKRKLRRLTMKKGDDKKSLLYFTGPKEIKGSGLLSWRNNKSENQWLYIPSLKKLQRIASGSKKNYFMGTDFTYADLDGEILEKNNYKCLRTIKCHKGDDCYVIEAKPINEKEKRNTGYSKRMLLVHKKRLTTDKIIYYNLKNQKFKTAQYMEWVQVSGLWRPDLAMMDRHGVQKTYIKILKRKLNKTIDKVVFSKRYLEKEMHMN